MKTISQQLIKAAQASKLLISPASLNKIEYYLYSQINPDGGFKGRSAESDLYYTMFGIDCLQALELPIPYNQLHSYLQQFEDGNQLEFVHHACLIRCLMKMNQNSFINPDILESFFEKTQSHNSTIYNSFLTLMAIEDIKSTLNNGIGHWTDKPAQLNFDNINQLSQEATPVIAAAAVINNQLGLKDTYRLSRLLFRHLCSHGGFRASNITPLPDLLSTATALFALDMLDIPLNSIQEKTFTFVKSLWQEDGGFCGHLADSVSDCEYTFYGLLSLGILADYIEIEENKSEIHHCYQHPN